MLCRNRCCLALLLAACLVPLSGAPKAWGRIAVSPAYVEVPLDTGRPAGRFLISNLGDEEERFRINALHFVYTPGGAVVQSRTGERSLAQWLHFNPRELTIAPRTQRAVRFAIVPQGHLEEGEYWAAMELENLRQMEATSEGEDGKAVKIRMVATIMVPIFGTVGDVDYEGEVRAIDIVDMGGIPRLMVLVGNTGTGRLGVAGTFEIRDEAGELVLEGKTGGAYVLPNSERAFRSEIEKPLPAGRYKVNVSYRAVHLDEQIEYEGEVDWTPPNPEPSTQPGEPASAAPAATAPAATAPATEPAATAPAATAPAATAPAATAPATQP